MKKIFIACSKWCYKYIPDIKKALELMDYEVILPNYYDNPFIEEELRGNKKAHEDFCRESFEIARRKSEESDAVLVLNFDKVKDGVIYPNYIGGATFLEMYDSYLLGHDIFIYNEIPNSMLKDEIKGMRPTILYGNTLNIKEYYGKQKENKKC